LWLITTVIVVLVFADMSFGVGPLHPDEPEWMILLDRVFDSSALLMLAIVVHLWIRSLRLLEENQLLLEKHMDLSRELQHRVRNDLQVLLQFLDEQAEQTGDLNAKDGFEFVARRVMSLGQIYDHLVGTETSRTLDFADYLRSLCSKIGEFQKIHRAGVVLTCHTSGPLLLDLDTATALGIIVNELIANSYEHAFPDSTGSIEVSLRHKEGDAQAVLTVDDDGSGFVESAIDSVGLGLVRRLVARIKGTIEFRVNRGTKWSITLPVPTEG